MRLSELQTESMSLEAEQEVRFRSYSTERPTKKEAEAALADDNPVLYAKNKLNIGKAPDSTSQSVIRYLEAIANSNLKEAEDMSELQPMQIDELQKKIREGCKPDKDTGKMQQWANALELVHKAYSVLNITRPTPGMKGAWTQYEDLISFAVKELSKTRGLDDESWRMSAPSTK